MAAGLSNTRAERRLYVSESRDQAKENPRQCIRMFELSSDGTRLPGGESFHKIEPGYCDGLHVNEDGNLWSSAAAACIASIRAGICSETCCCRISFATLPSAGR